MSVEYIINDWAMDLARHQLENRQTKAIRAPNNHVLQLLQVFVVHPGETLPPYFLIQHVWPNKPVGINSLRVSIRALRVALDDSQKPPTVILTVPGKGYQLNPDYLKIVENPVSVPVKPIPAQIPLATLAPMAEPPVSSPLTSPSTRVKKPPILPLTTSRHIVTGCVLSLLGLLWVLYFLVGFNPS